MGADPETIRHLESARACVDRQTATISMADNELTEATEHELLCLRAARDNIDAALRHLTDCTDEHVGRALPADGRYSLGNDVFSVELRIDLEVSNIVSADFFRLGTGYRREIASLRTYPGTDLDPASRVLEVTVQSVHGELSRGLLTIQAEDEIATATLILDNPLKALPAGEAITLVGRYRGASMRRLGLEIEYQEGLETEVTWFFHGQRVTIESCLEDVGFETRRSGRRNSIPSPSSGLWDDAQLHGLMTRFGEEPLARPDWCVHVLMLGRARKLGVNGLMFDTGPRDTNHLPRQGVAIFQEEIRLPFRPGREMKERRNWRRKLIQTSVHEIGHALNLAHRFERQQGRADSLSFMNYDWRYEGGGNKGGYWSDFAFEFDADELAFLRHGPHGTVIPGGAAFGAARYWENVDGHYVSYRREVRTRAVRLSLLPPSQAAQIYKFGQPVLLTVELLNASERPLKLPRYLLDPKAGFLEIIVRRQRRSDGSDELLKFNPVVHRCFSREPIIDRIPPGGKITNNVNLTYGSAGFTFMEPGNYTVTAVFSLTKSPEETYIVESDPLHLRIAYPRSNDEEREGLEIFRPDVGMYLAFGGSDILTDAADTLQAIVERRQHNRKTVRDPLVTNILRCQAINYTRDFVRYAKGRYEIRPAEPDKACELFASIARASSKVFDVHTRRETRQLARSQPRE